MKPINILNALLALSVLVAPAISVSAPPVAGGANPFDTITDTIAVVQTETYALESDLQALQTELDAAVARIDTLEGKVAVIESQIVDLQATDADLQSQIDAVVQQAVTNNSDISSLLSIAASLTAQIVKLQSDVDENGNLIQSSADAIAALEAEQAIQKDLILANIDGLAALLDEQMVINTTIGNLDSKIVELNAELETKQDILQNQCAGEETVQTISADGAVTCVTSSDTLSIGTTVTNQTTNFTAYKRYATYHYHCQIYWFWGDCAIGYGETHYSTRYTDVTSYCPVGTVRTGSFVNHRGTTSIYQGPVGDRGWRAYIANGSDYNYGFSITNTCINTVVN